MMCSLYNALTSSLLNAHTIAKVPCDVARRLSNCLYHFYISGYRALKPGFMQESIACNVLLISTAAQAPYTWYQLP